MLKRYDTSQSSWVDASSVKRYDNTLGAWLDASSVKKYDTTTQAWAEQLAYYVGQITSNGFNPPHNGTVEIEKTSIKLNLKAISSYQSQNVYILFNAKVGDTITFDYTTDLGTFVCFMTVSNSGTLWLPPNGVGSAYNSSGEFKIESSHDASRGIRIQLGRVNIGLTTFPEVNVTISNLKINGIACYFTR